jgi:Fur family ferric uptake transcriptional regulator
VGKRKPALVGSAGVKRSPNEHAELLRSFGLKKTAPRVAVLQFLERTTAPMTHGEIAEEMAVFGFDRATVYRNLIALVDAHLVARSDMGDHVWRFEMRRGNESHIGEHPHFLCVSCGGVTCLPGGTVKVMSARGVPRAVTGRDVEVQLKGRCDACAT